jgi:hypothetical protein
MKMKMHLPNLPFSRREFLSRMGGGLGLAGLGSLLARNGLLGPVPALGSQIDSPAANAVNPLAPRTPHFAPRAKSCIFIFLDGGLSQMDLFDPKPKLHELHGQMLPDSMLKNVRFAFINKDAKLKASPRTFKKHGQCGMEFSDLLPRLAGCADDLCMIRSMVTEQFNHHPASLMLQCGQPQLGLPSMGSWLLYGLGCESQNLPAYVVLTGGRGTSGASTLWHNGFFNSSYAGVLFRTRGEPVLNLANPPGMPSELRRKGLDVLRELNQGRFEQIQDPEIEARIASYELAFRMQSAALEVGDLSGETRGTLDSYGIGRADPDVKIRRDGGPGQYRDFATNCLMARRLVERGVRFINIFHASWDFHEDVDGELPFYSEMVDQPITALLQDLKQRGLLDETLVVIGSEFGRTPLGQGDGGRDHHPFAFTTLMAGGGVRPGYVHGETDDIGWAPVRDVVSINDFQATLLHLFGLDHRRLTYKFKGLDQRLTSINSEAHVVPELLG